MKTTNQSLHNSFLALVLGVFTVLLAVLPASAANLYWDSNGSTAGAGATPTGTWGTSSFWNTFTNGGAGTFTAATVSTDFLFFAAGADAVNPYTVTLSANQVATNIMFQSAGAVTLSAATPKTITLGAIGNASPSALVVTNGGGNATIGTNVTILAVTGTTYVGKNGMLSGGELIIENGGMMSNSVAGFTFDGTNTVVTVKTGGKILQQPAATSLAVNVGNVAGNTATLNVQGGDVLSTGAAGSASGLIVGNAGIGIVNLSSGTITVSASANGVNLGRTAATGNGTFNLDGGLLTTPGVRRAGGATATGIFNFNGGTIKALINTTIFMTNLTSANVKSGGAIIDDGGFAIVIGQPLLDGAPSGGLIKKGVGTLTLMGANTYTGNTTISNGTLAVSGSVAGDATVKAGATLSIPVGGSVAGNVIVGGTNTISGSVVGNVTVQTNALLSGNGAANGAVTVNSGGVITAGVSGVGNLTLGTLTLGAAGGDTQTVNVTLGTAIISVTGALTVNGTNTINVSSSGPAPGTYDLITYSGPQITSGFVLGTKPAGSTLQYGATSIQLVVVDSLLWTGAANALWDTTTTNWQYLVAGTPVNYANNISVLFNDSGANPSITLNSSVTPGNVVFTNDATSYSLSGSGGIGGTFNITKDGAGVLTLGTTNTYSGGTTLQGAGLLTLTNGKALGIGTLNLKSTRTNNLATVLLSGGITVTNPIAIDDSTGREGFYSTNGNNTLTGPITISGVTVTNHVLFQNDGAPGTLFTVSSSISGSTLTGGLSLRGTTNALGLVAGRVNINSGFQINGEANWTISSTSNNWTQTFLTGGTNGGNLILGANDSLATNSRVLWDNQTSGSLDIAGYNQTVSGLSHANPTTGSPRVGNSSSTTDSLLKIYGGGYSYYGTLVDKIGAGTRKLSIELLSGSQILNGDNTYSGTTTIDSGATLTIGTNGVTGSISNTASILNNGTLSINRSDAFVFTNVFTGAGNVTVAGAVVLPISSSSAISSGTIQISTAQLDTTRVELSGGITLTNALTLRPRNYTVSYPPHIVNVSGINTLNPAADISYPAGGNAQVLQSDSGRLILTKGFATTQSAPRYVVLQGAADGEVQGSLSANNGLAKHGSGTWTLSGSSPLVGPTLVNDGTLVVNGSFTAAANVVTVSAGTLAGSGTIAGPVTLQTGSTLSPGNSVGTLTLNGNLTLNAGSTNVFEVNGSTPTNDLVVVGGTVSYDGVLKIVPTGSFSGGQSFILFSGAGATNASNFASIEGTPGSGKVFAFTNGVLSVVSTSVTPVQLTNSVSGNLLTFTWPAGQGWTLQSETNSLSVGLTTNSINWGTVPGGIDGSNGITINPANPTVFYRLSHP